MTVAAVLGPIGDLGAHRYPLAAFAKAVGLSKSQAMKQFGLPWRSRNDGLGDGQAERVATRAGLHPFEIWPELADDRIAALEVECEADGCDERFMPSITRGPNQRRFCSRRCGQRMARRRRRRSPAYRARLAAYARSWHNANPGYNAAQARAWYRRNRELVLARQKARDAATGRRKVAPPPPVSCEACGDTFQPYRRGHRFCTPRCQNRLVMRRARAERAARDMKEAA